MAFSPNLDSILKSRDITWPEKVRLVKAMVFPVVVYRCESWTIKKAEHRRIDAFELWCWRRLLRVSWTAAYQAPPSMVFSRQGYWSRVPLPSPMTNLDNTLKIRAYKGPSSQSYGFPVVVYRCESWTIKKAECQGTDAFEL